MDEAGRGCLAGPVVAAAVILDPNSPIPGINDSKKLSPPTRARLAQLIKAGSRAYAVSFVDNKVIDKINILNAAFRAMETAIAQLAIKPDISLIDGHLFRSSTKLNHQCIVKGDGKYASIAAASILAKVERDRFMEALHKNHQHYHWNRNKGYPTKAHINAIKEQGFSDHHRISFHVKSLQLEVDL